MILSNGSLLQRGSSHSWAHAVLLNVKTTKIVKAAIEALRFMADPFLLLAGYLAAVADPAAGG
jgi:hypothetical protein